MEVVNKVYPDEEELWDMVGLAGQWLEGDSQ